MIAISSFRPFKFQEYAHQQVLAKKTWDHAFKWIFYYGDKEPHLGNAFFFPSAGKPTIRQMCKKAFELLSDGFMPMETWACLINADIAVRPGTLRKAEQMLTSAGAMCGLSKRYEMPADGNFANAQVDGNALDFFCARKEVWKIAAMECPEQFKLGHNLWDTWMASFFANNWPNDSYDLTPSRIFFHPKHESRGNQSVERPARDHYLDKMRYPVHILQV